MKTNYKNIFLGIIIGVIGTCGVFFIVGDVNVETEIQIGEKSGQDDKDIRISIERNIDENGQEIVNVSATGRGSVTKEDIEQELAKLFAEKNIDASSGIEAKITLDSLIDFQQITQIPVFLRLGLLRLTSSLVILKASLHMGSCLFLVWELGL